MNNPDITLTNLMTVSTAVYELIEARIHNLEREIAEVQKEVDDYHGMEEEYTKALKAFEPNSNYSKRDTATRIFINKLEEFLLKYPFYDRFIKIGGIMKMDHISKIEAYTI